ncbi:hypothetical protein N8500_11090 [Candidatus Puniceispirillum sp.]|nr:hypothetical protein [Candidatus Puniceispirillum sp.]
MNKEIKIVGHPCGSGKTTKMIENFKEDRKYLVILPLLSEVTRVIEGSKDIEFVQPNENDNKHVTKTSSLESQLLLGSNIATTHEMYERLVPMVKAGLLDDYDIIIGEVPNVVKSITSKSRTSIQEFYVDAGYMDVDVGTGLVRPTHKWRQNQDQVSETLSPKILKYAETGCLYLQDGEMFIWDLPQCILPAGRSVAVMTSTAEGSMLLSYLRKLGLRFEVSNDNHPKPGIFAKNSRLKDANWIANTTRGTNDYIHCSHFIYLYNQSINHVVARWLGNSSRAFNDAYALTKLIQWVWRFKVRRGEPIILYLPSPRMRRLFEKWLYGGGVIGHSSNHCFERSEVDVNRSTQKLLFTSM